MFKNLILFVLGFICLPVFGQNIYQNSNVQWFGYTVTAKLNEKLDFVFNAQERRKDAFRNQNLILFRPGFAYHLSPKVSLAAGYAHLDTYISESQDKIENRYWEQISYKTAIKDIDFSGRFRVEQRFSFVKNKNTENQGKPYEDRFRFQAKVDKVLNKNGKNNFLLSVNDEFMLNKNVSNNTIAFDQNRFYAGLIYRFKKNHRIEGGYMLVDQPTDSKNVKRTHIWTINLYSTFDFRKKHKLF
jgi:Protein of unknown function (DUF2490)